MKNEGTEKNVGKKKTKQNGGMLGRKYAERERERERKRERERERERENN